MNQLQALALLGELPSAEMAGLWSRARPLGVGDLRDGIWLGRNGGMPWAIKRFTRHVVRRDYFAKLLLGGWGVNIRVKQDGSHAPLASSLVEGGARTDMPFRVAPDGLDYGLHVLGFDLGTLVQPLRDEFRVLPLQTLADTVATTHLRRVGAWPQEQCPDTDIVLGYILPLGVTMLRSTPFGMVWSREATEPERRAAQAWVRSARLIDTSPGVV